MTTKLKCVLDTSAILSLEATSKIQLANKYFSIIAPEKVREELHEIAKTSDKLGSMANNILESPIIEFIILEENLKSSKGEIEVVSLANNLEADFILMDDIKARKKLEKQTNIPIKFSPFLIFALYQKGDLTRKESLMAIENMKIKRNWKENLIIDYAKILLEKD